MYMIVVILIKPIFFQAQFDAGELITQREVVSTVSCNLGHLLFFFVMSGTFIFESEVISQLLD